MSNADDLYVRCCFLFEIINGELVRKVSVSPNAQKDMVAGNFDKKLGYKRVKVDRKSYLVHRLIYLMTYGELPELVDHIDGDTTNNNPDNLREATKANNRWNCNPNKDTVSGVKGVYNDRGRWKALVNFKGERYYLGMYSSINEASKVVKDKYEELQGEFSKSLSMEAA